MEENKNLINEKIKVSNLQNVDVISDENIKSTNISKNLFLLFQNLEQFHLKFVTLKYRL